MILPKEDFKFNWGDLWADLLKGAGRGLLVHDGSRAAQAALAGLEVFDAAQERRRRPGRKVPGDRAYQDILLKVRSILSPEEWAALQRLPLGDQHAWAEEWAEALSDGAPPVDHAFPTKGSVRPPVAARPLPYAGRPISVNPLDGWHLQSALPFGSDGRLNSPTYRR